MQSALESPTTRPYLIRALYEWCVDQGYTPYLAVLADNTVQVPREYVRDGQIVLNVGADATSSLMMGNEFVEFKARFAGVVREIMVPVNRVMAIYARENGQGMAFPVEVGTDETDPSATQAPATESGETPPEDPPPRAPPAGSRPFLKRIK
jgi:stringent starvation protein B